MKILFDQGTPAPLRPHLSKHTVETLADLGWSSVSNGELLERAETEGYQVLITTDQNLKYQQNLANRKLCILVLKTTSWPRIKKKVTEINEALEDSSGTWYRELEF